MFFTANAILIVMKHTSMFVDLITILSDTLQLIGWQACLMTYSRKTKRCLKFHLESTIFN